MSFPIRSTAVVAFLLALGATMPAVATDATPVRETILFVRHAEKPAAGFGQLSCKGLNRALALAAVIRAKYGHVDAVFAPDPAWRKKDGAAAYDYLRPLATVEPTAIAFGLPVQADFGYEEIDKLRDALLAPAYRDATVLVGWEHHKLNTMVPALIASLGGDAAAVRPWEKDDFDSIWRVTIERVGERTSASFALDREGLDGQSSGCPK